MLDFTRWKILAVTLVILAGILLAIPSLLPKDQVERWPAWLRRRWIIKDLAQLAYSCPPKLISPVERLRFFKRYLNLTRIDAKAKRLARAVLRREASLKRKHGPYRDWDRETQYSCTEAA